MANLGKQFLVWLNLSGSLSDVSIVIWILHDLTFNLERKVQEILGVEWDNQPQPSSIVFDRLCSTFAQYYPWQKTHLISLDLLFLGSKSVPRILSILTSLPFLCNFAIADFAIILAGYCKLLFGHNLICQCLLKSVPSYSHKCVDVLILTHFNRNGKGALGYNLQSINSRYRNSFYCIKKLMNRFPPQSLI